MSEEIKHPGAELNDAALSNVSGGEAAAHVRSYAARICRPCMARNGLEGWRCVGGEEALAAYIGLDGRIFHWQDCPFLRKPE